MKNKYHQIAELMGDVCHEVLWNDGNNVFSNTRFSTRVGSGRATYCKFSSPGKQIQITFGKKMIESKFYAHEACHWLSYREISKRNYYQSDTSLLSVLSQTVCHEFAHALQQLNRQVFRGSIHNPYFYQHLDRIHESGQASLVKVSLDKKCNEAGIELVYDQPEITLHDVYTTTYENKIVLNSVIQFSHKQKTFKGRVIKINRKTYTVEIKSRFYTQHWRIPKQLAVPA